LADVLYPLCFDDTDSITSITKEQRERLTALLYYTILPGLEKEFAECDSKRA
jgi:hypothetical protein